MKLLSVSLAAMMAASVQAQVGTTGTAKFEADYNKLREQKLSDPANSGLTEEEEKLYWEIINGRDVSHCGCTNNDPHIYTYDGLHTDCQGKGDYIFSKSTTTDFMVQARFSIESTNSNWNAFTRTRTSESFVGTAQKGGVVYTGYPGEPKVEAFAGTRTGTEVHHCKVQWFFDDVEQNELAGGNINNGHGIYDLGWGIIWRSGTKRFLYFRESKVYIEYQKWEWKAWGCALNMCVCLPEEIRNSGLVGLLGSADGNPDNDYMTRDGTVLTGSNKPDTIAENNKYCNENWCLGEGQDDENIFKHPINSCNVDVTDDLDIAVEGASEELKELCLFNRDCIMDAIVANDSTLGTRTLENADELEKHDIDPNRNPEDGQEEDSVDDLPIERYSGGKICKHFDDYDYGYKMGKCRNGKSGPFDGSSLTRTGMKNEATCDGSTNPGTFELECFDSLGNNKHKTFKFTPSVDTAVKIRGKNSNGNGNILYKDLKAGVTYDFTDIGNGQWIQELEFCFRCADVEPPCPEDVKECADGSFVQRQAPTCEFRECPVCPADVKTCPDGTELTRDITNGCEYPECPPCDDGTFECPNGDILTRDPATCEFPLCPPCADDTKTCPGGEVLSRRAVDCMFPECPVVDEPMTTNAPPGTRGDPHFKTHGGDMFDFHGGCDLVLVDNPTYKNGLGLTIHIRTKIETWWSFVESAVIKIGEETLEVTGKDADVWMWLNGVAKDDIEDDQWNQATLAGNLLRFKSSKGLYKGKLHRHEAHVYLGNGEKITFKTFNDFLKVEFVNESEATLAGSHGILGTYPEGNRVGRDGVTLIEDVNAYGQEWQVTPEEPKLFHSYDDAWVVPAGNACAMPSSSAEKVSLRRRRLESGISTEAAEKACSHLSGADAKACVYDVLATQNMDMAGAW